MRQMRVRVRGDGSEARSFAIFNVYQGRLECLWVRPRSLVHFWKASRVSPRPGIEVDAALDVVPRNLLLRSSSNTLKATS